MKEGWGVYGRRTGISEQRQVEKGDLGKWGVDDDGYSCGREKTEKMEGLLVTRKTEDGCSEHERINNS